MYIIQTNTSVDDDYTPVDFQSMIYKITKQTWDEFKDYILSDENFTYKIIRGTMIGSTKPRQCKILKTLINDNNHLEVIIELPSLRKFNAKYVLVTDEQFQNLL